MVFFFFLPNLSYFECERRNQRQTLSQRRWGAGEADVLIYSTLRLFIKAHSVRQPAKHLISLSLAFLTSIYILLVTYSAPEPAVSPIRPEQMCSQQDLYLPGSVWDICHAGILFLGIFGDLEKIVCFSLKPTYNGA